MIKKINLTEHARELLSNFFKNNSGLEIRAETWGILENAILQRMNKLKINNIDEYINLLKSTYKQILWKASEFMELLNLVTIKETQFFRTLPHFNVLKEKILPKLLNKNKNIRIWSAGCSIGCEPYSIAICVLEKMPLKETNVEILATDISTDALEYAKAGIFTKSVIRNVDKNILNKYFIEENGKYKIVDRVKKLVNFYYHNLISEIYPRNIDVIFSRNVTIYFDRETTTNIINKFYDALNEDGILIIGHSESLYGFDTDFELVDMEEALVYRKPKKEIKLPLLPVVTDLVEEKEKVKLQQLIEEEKLRNEALKQLFYLYNKKDYDVAINYALDIIKKHSRFYEIYTLLGKIFLNRGDYEKTIKYLKDALNINMLDKEAHFLLAMAYYKLGDKIEAVKEFKKTIYLEPDFALIHFHLANLYKELGMNALAIKEYRITIELLGERKETKLSEFMEGINEETLIEVCQINIEKLKDYKRGEELHSF